MRPSAPSGPVWASLGALWHQLLKSLAVTCAARLGTGAGVRTRGVLGGRLAIEAALSSWHRRIDL